MTVEFFINELQLQVEKAATLAKYRYMNILPIFYIKSCEMKYSLLIGWKPHNPIYCHRYVACDPIEC